MSEKLDGASDLIRDLAAVAKAAREAADAGREYLGVSGKPGAAAGGLPGTGASVARSTTAAGAARRDNVTRSTPVAARAASAGGLTGGIGAAHGATNAAKRIGRAAGRIYSAAGALGIVNETDIAERILVGTNRQIVDNTDELVAAGDDSATALDKEEIQNQKKLEADLKFTEQIRKGSRATKAAANMWARRLDAKALADPEPLSSLKLTQAADNVRNIADIADEAVQLATNGADILAKQKSGAKTIENALAKIGQQDRAEELIKKYGGGYDKDQFLKDQSAAEAMRAQALEAISRGDFEKFQERGRAAAELGMDARDEKMWRNPGKLFFEGEQSRIAGRNYARSQMARAGDRTGD